MKKLNIALIALFTLVIIGGLIMTTVQCAQNNPSKKNQPETPLEKIPFDGAHAHKYLVALCGIGPRPSGSEGMKKQQAYLEEHFKACGATVEYQRFTYRHQDTASDIPCANMIIRWKPERKERLLLAAHYDTLPIATLDPPGRMGPFVGANDAGCCVAMLMEMAKSVPEMLEKHQKKYGIDFVMLDAEEYMYRQGGRLCVGSEYFARQYAGSDPKAVAKSKAQPKPVARDFTYRWGVLLDMCGETALELPKDRSSWRWRDTRPLVEEIWGIAEELGVREFQQKVRKGEIVDDHIMLHDLGKIPCIDIIDMDYAWWHTSQDTPDKCSPLKMARVAWVVMEWVKRAE